MRSLCSSRSLWTRQPRIFTRISQRPVTWTQLSFVRFLSSTGTVSEPQKQSQEVTDYQKWLPPGVRQVTIPDNEWDSVLFSARHSLKALDKIIEKCRTENRNVDFDALQKFRSYLEHRAANEVVMEFEVDEDTYNDIMCKCDPNFVPTISWETKLRNGIGPRLSTLRPLIPLLRRFPSTWVEQLVMLAEARDEKFLESGSKLAKALKLYHEQIKKKEPKVEASKPSPSPSTSDVEPPDTKQHLFYKNVKHLESLAKFGYEKSSTSNTFIDRFLRPFRNLKKTLKNATISSSVASTNKRIKSITESGDVKHLDFVPDMVAEPPRSPFWWFDRTPYFPKDLTWTTFRSDLAAAQADIFNLLKDPTFLTSEERASFARTLSVCFDPFTFTGEMKIYTRPSFNPPTMFRPSPYTPEEVGFVGFERVRDRVSAVLMLENPQPLTALEEIISLKLHRLWTDIYPLATPAERWEFAETFDISPGERTLEWVHSFPPPLHTYEELPILKEPEEDPHWHQH